MLYCSLHKILSYELDKSMRFLLINYFGHIICIPIRDM